MLLGSNSSQQVNCLQQTGNSLSLLDAIAKPAIPLQHLCGQQKSKKRFEAAYFSKDSALMNDTPQTQTLHLQVFLNHL